MQFKFFILIYSISLLFIPLTDVFGQAKVKSVPFNYVPDASDDRYNQRLKQKTLPVNETDFVILSKKSDTEFAVERYDANLNKTWTAGIPLKEGETVETFAKNSEAVFVLTYRSDQAVGSQVLSAHVIDLKSGQKQPVRKIFEAPSKSRKIGVSISEDGTKVAAFQYLTQEERIKAISLSIFDGRLQKLKDQTYNLRDIASNFSANLRLDNQGNQYLCILSDENTKLAVRKYANSADEAKVMSVQLGGTLGGRQVSVFDIQYHLEQNGLLFAVAVCMDQGTAEYYSLKTVKFDFAAGEMEFAPEFKFTAEYLNSLNKLYPASKPVKRLEDIELSAVIYTADKDLLIIAEKKYTEGGEDSPYVARELHLFAYDEFLNLAWRSFIMKNQVSPPEEGFSGISFKATYQSGNLNLLTLETLNGKTDLYSRNINTRTGAGDVIVPIGLNVANDKAVAYIKDFSAWLNPKTLIVVSRPSKKSASLQLNRISLK